MPQDITLATSRDTMHELFDLVETKKQVVKVDRDVLSRLLVDHTVLYQAAKSSSQFHITEPAEARPRIKIQV